MATGNKYYSFLLPDGESGVVDSWGKCEAKVKGLKGARYRGFKTKKEAEEWLFSGARYGVKKPAEKGVYFDAGTGRGEGVEVSVTDESGNDLLKEIILPELVNKHGKHLLPVGKTNNYGELLACLFAIRIAERKKIKKIFGDSKLIIDYWSKGFIKKVVTKETIKLAFEVVEARKKFEHSGGEITLISGDDNPADLGFHRK